MKNFIFKFFIPFLAFLLIASPMISKLSAFGINSAVLMLALIVTMVFSVAYFRQPHFTRTSVRNGVEVEMWANYILERLWKLNQFMQSCFSDDDKVLGGKIVHIPQPGALPTVVKNRTVFPAVAVRRADTDVLYALDVYSTDPTHITDAEKVEPSYDKINSVYGDHSGALATVAADNLILSWLAALPQTAYYYTTGAAVPAIEGAVGNRKAFTYKDVKKIMTKLNKQNVPTTDRFCLLSSDMMQQFTDSLTDSQQNAFNQFYNEETGVIGKYAGFTFYERSSVAYAETTAPGGVTTTTISAYGAAIDDTTNDVAIFWHRDAVTRALGEVKFFENQDRAEYQGDIYSALLRLGGRRRRADNSGIIVAVQAASA
jgi:hypothetical protein